MPILPMPLYVSCDVLLLTRSYIRTEALARFNIEEVARLDKSYHRADIPAHDQHAYSIHFYIIMLNAIWAHAQKNST